MILSVATVPETSPLSFRIFPLYSHCAEGVPEGFNSTTLILLLVEAIEPAYPLRASQRN